MRWIKPPGLHGALLGGVLFTALAAPELRAEPAEIQFSAPVVSVPANYILDGDPSHSGLEVRVAATVTRNQFCPSGDLLLPCPPQNTPVRITASLVAAGGFRPVASTTGEFSYSVGGNANFDIEESLVLTPERVLAGTEYSVRITVEHVDDLETGALTPDHEVATGPHTVLHLHGRGALRRHGGDDCFARSQPYPGRRCVVAGDDRLG